MYVDKLFVEMLKEKLIIQKRLKLLIGMMNLYCQNKKFK